MTDETSEAPSGALGMLTGPALAYLMGAVAASGTTKGDRLELRLRGSGRPVLRLLELADFVAQPGLPGVVSVAPRLALVASNWLGAPPGDVAARMPAYSSDFLSRAFLRGVFDQVARVSRPEDGELEVALRRVPAQLMEGLLSALGIAPKVVTAEGVIWDGVAALDLLGIVYDDALRAAVGSEENESFGPLLARKKALRRYAEWCGKTTELRAEPWPLIRVQRTRPEAIVPAKGRISDSGYDLTLVAELKRVGPTILYGTGISAEPPQGYYLDVVPRSSIIKLGYTISNSVGIIDRAYRGEIMVPLVKLDPSVPDLLLPARVAQLIPRPIVHFPLIEVESLSHTHRGTGGFGSSGPAHS